MRQFTKVIFCGSGEYSGQQIERLKSRLEGGIYLLSGLQQPGHPESEQAALENEDGMEELRDIVRDIATALGCGELIKE